MNVKYSFDFSGNSLEGKAFDMHLCGIRSGISFLYTLYEKITACVTRGPCPENS
jgi:hypothetical protein